MKSLGAKLGLAFVAMLLATGMIFLGVKAVLDLHEKDVKYLQDSAVPRILALQDLSATCAALYEESVHVARVRSRSELEACERNLELLLDQAARSIRQLDEERGEVRTRVDELEAVTAQLMQLQFELVELADEQDVSHLVSGLRTQAENLELDILLGRYQGASPELFEESRLSLLSLATTLSYLQLTPDSDEIHKTRQGFQVELRALSARIAEFPKQRREQLRSLLEQLLETSHGDRGAFAARIDGLRAAAELEELILEQSEIATRLRGSAKMLSTASESEIDAMDQERARQLGVLKGELFSLFVALAAVIVFAGCFVEFRLARRLRILVRDVKRISEGDLDAAVQGGGDYELAELARAAEVFRRNAVELLETSNALAERNTALAEFAHAASHDIKSPLRGISHLASWVIEGLRRVASGRVEGAPGANPEARRDPRRAPGAIARVLAAREPGRDS